MCRQDRATLVCTGSQGAYGERNMSQKILQWNRWLVSFFLCALANLPQALADEPAKKAETDHKPPVQLTAREDHQRMMELLKIKSLRPGANPNDPKSPNAANYDESKANP